jgi:phage tail sheath protein FI
MPVTPTYPGVYVEEIPSGVRTITGVATSITAFIGRARRGPTNEAVTINSFGDFERIFGGLWLDSPLGYAVRDFYLNGGSQAIIVRLYRADGGDPNVSPPVEPPLARSVLTLGTINLVAADEGKWGANLRASIDNENVSDDIARRLGLASKDDLFNLTVRDTNPGGITERFLNLSVKNSPRRIDKVLEAESQLVVFEGILPNAPPAPTGDDLTHKENVLTEKRRVLERKQIDTPGANTAVEQKAVSDAQTELNKAKTAKTNALSDGLALTVGEFLPDGGQLDKEGLFALEQADLFNLLCIPPYTPGEDVDGSLLAAAATYCEERRAMLIIDPKSNWVSKQAAKESFTATADDYPGIRSKNAALFFPRLREPNPLRDNQVEDFAPCGAVAGVFARTDTERGVWKAPAGIEATLKGVPALKVVLTDDENGELNPLGINCLRTFPVFGRVVWGARTLRGADQLADEYKYIPVRRTALFIEESLFRGLKWVVFEPNDEPLWAQIRLNAGAFMQNMFRQGAFQGKSPREAYFVKCDKETTTQNDINLGIVNVVVGFAPLKPAEFVIIKLQQMAGQIDV